MPEKTKRVKNKTGMYEPWITKGIVRSMSKLKQLYIKMLKNKENTTDIEKYKTYRRILQQVKRKTKMYYYRSRCKEFKNDTRKLWSVINTITGRTKKKETIIESLKINHLSPLWGYFYVVYLKTLYNGFLFFGSPFFEHFT